MIVIALTKLLFKLMIPSLKLRLIYYLKTQVKILIELSLYVFITIDKVGQNFVDSGRQPKPQGE